MNLISYNSFNINISVLKTIFIANSSRLKRQFVAHMVSYYYIICIGFSELPEIPFSKNIRGNLLLNRHHKPLVAALVGN